MNTKERILDAALTLFSEKGYHTVSVAQIADDVGIKAPSLYKHYKSKRDIFDAILSEMQTRYENQANTLNMNGNNATADADIFSSVSEDALIQMGIGLFTYFLHDDYVCRFRKMLTIEQFHDAELSALYTKQYTDDPLSYQSAILSMLCAAGLFRPANANIMALHFYAPLYLLLTLCDREPAREPEALQLLEQHIRQFNLIYQKEETK
ncbi:MAG: TetR/AcrR family transcriptional regulator [Lachnospiraceae bacterium]|nr:TetR/AcrR family transcriptional regulator [Lachnospiraceae bacterium]